MWQELVPMTSTSVAGDETPAPGTPAWASMMAAETGCLGASPKMRGTPGGEHPGLPAGAVNVRRGFSRTIVAIAV